MCIHVHTVYVAQSNGSCAPAANLTRHVNPIDQQTIARKMHIKMQIKVCHKKRKKLQLF